MPKDKDRALNGAAARRKAEKRRALRKGQATVAAQRAERLAHRNPERLQKQIDELKSLESSCGSLSQKDKNNLIELERNVARIRKAKAAVRDQSQTDSREHSDTYKVRRGQNLGKLGHNLDQIQRQDASSDTDDDVQYVPLPQDTPPPIPRRRRDHDHMHHRQSNASFDEAWQAMMARPPETTPQLVYESKPVVRDLKRDAIGFVPSVVKQKMEATKGRISTRFLKEDELEELKRKHYEVTVPSEEDSQAQASIVEVSQESEALPGGPYDARFKQVQLEEVEEEEV